LGCCVGSVRSRCAAWPDPIPTEDKMTRFDRCLAMGRRALASNNPYHWEEFEEEIIRAYGRYSRAVGIWIDTEESDKVTDRIMSILEKEA